MKGRQGAFSDDRVIALAKEFVPCVDEVWRLQNRPDPDCRHFQGYMQDGHMRDVPNTKQGIYAATPGGRFLGSTSAIDGARMAEMLRAALEKWKAIPRRERLLASDPAKTIIERSESRYPKDGLVLKVHSRDLPRPGVPDDWRAGAWNLDFAWFRREELAEGRPAQLSKGSRFDWPAPLVRRLVRFHLVDNVRGQTEGYGEDQVVEAELSAVVTKVEKGVATMKLAGSTLASTTGRAPGERPDPATRGVRTRLLGTASFDTAAQRYSAFELVAVGSRWGASRFNFREQDRDLAPIGFVLTLAADRPADRIAPAAFPSYGWR